MVYCNDLFWGLCYCTDYLSVLFADDTTVVVKLTSFQDLMNRVLFLMKQVTVWFGANGLAVKDGKSQHLTISQGRNFGKIIHELCDPTVFEPLSFFMPNAKFENISQSACNLAGNFDKRDYVILLAGTNNALKNNIISLYNLII